MRSQRLKCQPGDLSRERQCTQRARDSQKFARMVHSTSFLFYRTIRNLHDWSTRRAFCSAERSEICTTGVLDELLIPYNYSKICSKINTSEIFPPLKRSLRSRRECALPPTNRATFSFSRVLTINADEYSGMSFFFMLLHGIFHLISNL